MKKNAQNQALVETSAACSVLIGASGTIGEHSSSAGPLIGLWQAKNGGLVQAVSTVRSSGVLSQVRIEDEMGGKMWVTIIPQGDQILLVGRDTGLMEKMAEALLESRALLKGLLDSAVDLSFEVSLDGMFRFISPLDAFGCQADKWLGLKAEDVFWPSGNSPARNPFRVNKKTDFDAIGVEFVSGEKKFVAMSVEPSFGPDNTIVGVRGTCRDVTARVEVAKQTRLDNLRLAVRQRITRILNASENAHDLLEAASNELIDVMRADLVWSVMKYKDGLVPVSLCGDRMEILDLDSIWRELAISPIGVQEIAGHGGVLLALRLERGGRGMGMVVIGRDTDISPWSAQERLLLEDIGEILTAAFGKAELIDRLYRLSGKDELTDLLNRRAFREVVEQRLKHQCRTGHSGCLIFIDLDHFKEVNDTLGHAAGDEAISLVAYKLQNIIRASDFAGRFGGDEFVLWIEDADEETAAMKAQELLDYMPEVRASIGNPELKLAASAGICLSRPGTDLTLKALTERADAALYEVKQSGKNSIAFASAHYNMDGEQS
ncbi:MAG: hypothetical protein COB37_09840 [Kordiimonadales bacterium]|nr:MAG: hypothetical protein COB37_09840 [Kordiimonadales bacterium]